MHLIESLSLKGVGHRHTADTYLFQSNEAGVQFDAFVVHFYGYVQPFEILNFFLKAFDERSEVRFA